MKARPLGGLSLKGLLSEIGLLVSDGDLLTLATLFGGADVLVSLEDPQRSADVAGIAWKAMLDAQRNRTNLPISAEVLGMLLVRTAFSDAEILGSSLEPGLRAVRLGWMGTWRELNLRLAGRLYAFLRTPGDLGDYVAYRACIRAALECWDIVEELDDTSDDDQRRRWRGMRAASQLFLARQTTDNEDLLRGAAHDFAMSEMYGDRTSQHCQLLSEVHLRLFEIGRDEADLAAASRPLDLARDAGLQTGGLVEARAGVHFVRGLRALTASRRISEPREGADAEHLADAPDAEFDPLDRNALLAGRSAFVASALLWTVSIGMPVEGRKDTVVAEIKRGQSLLRAAHASRLLGEPRMDLVVAAIRDLRPMGQPGSPISGPYWSRAQFEHARLLVGGGTKESYEEAALAVAIGLDAVDDDPDPDALLARRLKALEVEIDLRLLVIDEDVGAVRGALDAALRCGEDDVRVAITPMAYGARLLVSAEGDLSPDDTGLIRRVVDHLESTAERASGGHRSFAAGHAARLLMITDGAGAVSSVELAVLDRIHRLMRIVVEDDWQEQDLTGRLALAQAAFRKARLVAAIGDEDSRRAAIELFDETIEQFELVADRAGGWDLPPDDLPPGAESVDAALGIAESETGFVFDRRRISSMLGDSYLRRSALGRLSTDLVEAVTWLQRSADLGNETSEHLSLTGEAYLRLGRRTGAVEVLENAVSFKSRSRTAQGKDVVREAYSSAAAACYRLWELRGRHQDFAEAVRLAALAASTDPSWPWPLLQLAELAAASPRAAARLPALPPTDATTGIAAAPAIWAATRSGDVDVLRAEACRRFVNNREFMISALGGRRNWETYVLKDPHGLLSSTLVAKPVANRAEAEQESERTAAFRRYIQKTTAPSWVRTVQPLAVVHEPETKRWVIVSYRAAGVALSNLIEGADLGPDGPPAQICRAVERSVTLLAFIQGWRGSAPRGIDPFRYVVPQLERELGRLGRRDAARAARRWSELVPSGLPLVGKRDAHTENWLVTDSGAVVAVDLASRAFLPVGFEVAQLVEDRPLFDCSAKGEEARLALARTYLAELARQLPDLARSLPDVDSPQWAEAYACFAARRAIYLLARKPDGAGRGTLEATRSRHARTLLEWSIRTVPELAVLS
ncbi:hypothetical protein EV138_6458 [Kribbella voronezhensis]|uniref:Uncharacterized protein n=1 Tax=Kribbella voronezhensis TaxID=2512212 RepID=A0A4V3FIV7_9ACTN|nr:hypothetical protein [Kribbella voronezhensis]TDU83993.1 hypothetical protein EV138_6458 [Kribbella voronezhensis]